jgi:hypothetical protein
MFTSEKYHYELVSKKSAKESRKNFQYTLYKKMALILLLKMKFL